MKNLLKVSLGVLTSVGGFLEVGSLGTSLQAGAAFRYQLLWPIAFGAICVAFLTEMSGRLAACSHHTIVGAVRERFGISFQVWPFLTQVLVDLFVLASEVGGAALALQLVTGISIRIWAIPIVFLVWVSLWRGTFGSIEHGVAVLGLITLSFAVAAWRLGPEWHEVRHGLIPYRPRIDAAHYAYLAVGMLGATISPYLMTFYSSGAVEEKWTSKDLTANRIVSGLGMGFGSSMSMAIVVVAAIVLAPRGILAESYHQAAGVLNVPLGHWGFWLFCGSLFIGCVGAALELALDLSYITAQTFGFTWGENHRPSDEARFALTYTGALLLATLPSLAGVDPLKLTMFSMALTVVALPIIVGPLIVIMNDKWYLKSHTNGWISNIAVITVIAISFILAILAIPVQLIGG